MFITVLCKVKTINYDHLASAFATKAAKGSSYRRIQRFMFGFDLPMKIISSLIFSLLPEKENLTLVLDRTNWKFGKKNINIKPEQVMIAYKQRWQVETLFKALKSSRFDIESPHVTDLKRLERLFSLTMIAFLWCYRIGDYLDQHI